MTDHGTGCRCDECCGYVHLPSGVSATSTVRVLATYILGSLPDLVDVTLMLERARRQTAAAATMAQWLRRLFRERALRGLLPPRPVRVRFPLRELGDISGAAWRRRRAI